MKLLALVGLVLFAQIASAAPLEFLRWTGSEDANGDLQHVLTIVQQKTGVQFQTKEFLLLESRPLAYTEYLRYAQTIDGVPIEGKSIRIWLDRLSRKVVQVEASLNDRPTTLEMAKIKSNKRSTLTEKKAIEIARARIQNSSDPSIRGIDVREAFLGDERVQIVTIKGKRGKHKIAISQNTRKVIDQQYQDFPDADITSFPAIVYPIYEVRESTNEVLPRATAELKNLYTQVPNVSGDIFSSLRTRHYYDTDYSTILGATAAGRAQGAWSMAYIKKQARAIRAQLPLVANQFSSGFLLQGKYATINIHPDAFTHFTNLNFAPRFSSALFPNWIDTEVNGETISEMVPQAAYYGKPLMSAQEILDRPATRYTDNNPVSLLNDGFDEIQVYYAIDTLMEELQSRGFTDPALSTRPFNAFLFNPDIAYRDNAFYTDDTINFTTYSAGSANMARDNSTIWHELGHGVMDRLMGDNLSLADTGGLSEGMADFVAALVVEAVTQGKAFPGSDEFRIINKTGFFLTNEVHDDGEAYGGAMKDFLDATLARDGQAGLTKVTDVILEAMRLCRDHPGLTAKLWFEHILFADSLGRPGVREPGELKALLMKAVNGRNFKMDGGTTAAFILKDETHNREVVAGVLGSRSKPIPLTLAPNEVAHLDLSVSLKSSDEYAFTYPVTVKVGFVEHALQGAVHWVDEEKGPRTFVLNSEADLARIGLDVSGTCDRVNREDGSCVDYAYVQILDQNDRVHPHAKKRFYVQVKARTP